MGHMASYRNKNILRDDSAHMHYPHHGDRTWQFHHQLSCKSLKKKSLLYILSSCCSKDQVDLFLIYNLSDLSERISPLCDAFNLDVLFFCPYEKAFESSFCMSEYLFVSVF